MLELHMNSSYVCLLYLLNVILIFYTEDTTEVLLNALAVEFVAQIDEAIVSSEWWDPGFRHIRAGAVELALRRYLDLHLLEEMKQCDVSSAADTNRLRQRRFTQATFEQRAQRDARMEDKFLREHVDAEYEDVPEDRKATPSSLRSISSQSSAATRQMWYHELFELAKERTTQPHRASYGILNSLADFANTYLFSDRAVLPVTYYFQKHHVDYMQNIDWYRGVLYHHPNGNRCARQM